MTWTSAHTDVARYYRENPPENDVIPWDHINQLPVDGWYSNRMGPMYLDIKHPVPPDNLTEFVEALPQDQPSEPSSDANDESVRSVVFSLPAVRVVAGPVQKQLSAYKSEHRLSRREQQSQGEEDRWAEELLRLMPNVSTKALERVKLEYDVITVEPPKTRGRVENRSTRGVVDLEPEEDSDVDNIASRRRYLRVKRNTLVKAEKWVSRHVEKFNEYTKMEKKMAEGRYKRKPGQSDEYMRRKLKEEKRRIRAAKEEILKGLKGYAEYIDKSEQGGSGGGISDYVHTHLSAAIQALR